MEYKRKRLIRAAWQKAEAKRKQTVRQAESAADTEQQTPEEYAQTVVSEKTAQAAENVQSKALDTGRISYRQFRILQEKRQRVPTTHVAQPAETENTPLAQSADKRETFKRQRFRQKALDKQEIKTPDSYSDKMQALKRQHLTRETVRRHLQKQAGGTVLGSGVRLPDTVPVFSGGGIKQAALGRIRTVLQADWLRLKAILARTLRRAAGSLLALLGAGGVVLLLAMVIGAAAAVIGSPMGILFADESGDPNSIRIAEIVAETNADFGTAINDIVSAHPECSETTMEYDYEDGHTWASYWPEVLAVFAVQNNLNNDGDVVVIDESKKRLIQDTFWAMHEISAEVEEVTVTPEPTEDEPDPEPATEYILHIAVSSKSVDALADLYRFTQDQRDILHQLLSEEMRPSLLALCGGIAVADGELCWPLPGHTYISCHFGEADAFGNTGHRGTDIPAPEGTPILAAHSGTVLVSGWNDSYGNQVLLDNGAGLSTRYAHMTASAVTAGETVTAGQVIGYVGSTGDSTGNHLHFEVMQDGVRVNPMDMVSVR
ncbi:peptidoglycan DD-metalloendopeptidase family protein [Gemmiger formicilis]|uniref:M23 family metallopeptidase n=2 Tax=Gemmiger formicilis TaxID=745368 RepID=UPI00399A911F